MALTAAQVDRYRQTLLARRDELATGTARAESEVYDQDELARMDFADEAVADSAKDDLLWEAGRDAEILGQIEAALRRIDEGTYGICAQCGREIPTARLDAVPWALLCVIDQEIRDQEIADRKHRETGAVTGGAPSRVAR